MNGNLVDRIRHALLNLGGKAHLNEIYREVERISHEKLIGAWEATIRAEIHRHSSDTDSFDGVNDYFYSVEGKGKGIWGLKDSARPLTLEDL